MRLSTLRDSSRSGCGAALSKYTATLHVSFLAGVWGSMMQAIGARLLGMAGSCRGHAPRSPIEDLPTVTTIILKHQKMYTCSFANTCHPTCQNHATYLSIGRLLSHYWHGRSAKRRHQSRHLEPNVRMSVYHAQSVQHRSSGTAGHISILRVRNLVVLP
jgi:hypothetical protein